MQFQAGKTSHETSSAVGVNRCLDKILSFSPAPLEKNTCIGASYGALKGPFEARGPRYAEKLYLNHGSDVCSSVLAAAYGRVVFRG